MFRRPLLASLAISIVVSLDVHASDQHRRLLPNACSPASVVFAVNSTTDAVDANPGDGVCATSGQVCTLRAAVMEANQSTACDVTITLGNAAYTLTIPGTGETASAQGDLNPLRSMNIVGVGSGGTEIQASSTDTADTAIDRIFSIMGQSTPFTVNISHLTLRYGNPGNAAGGALLTNQNVNLTDVQVFANKADSGGGIASGGAGVTLSLDGSAVLGNIAVHYGGIMNTGGTLNMVNSQILNNESTGDNGGGIFASNGTVMTFTGSTIWANDCTGAGGGIYIGDGTLADNSRATMTNCTISGNFSASGGPLATANGNNSAALYNVTIADNSSGIVANGTVGLQNTILADQTTNCSGVQFLSFGHNVSSDLTCGTYLIGSGDINGANPKLLPMEYNPPGTTYTQALRIGSPAIDAGSGCAATDQRGVARPQGSACDIGAYEYNGGGSTPADFNNDQRSDILWRRNSGENAIYLMSGTNLSATGMLPVVSDSNWRVAGSGDFDGDFDSDVLWRHELTGQVVIWLLNGTSMKSAATVTTVSDTNWKIAGVGDFNADGKSDVVWRNSATGQVVIWLMNGTSIGSAAVVSTVADLSWTIAGVGDFNGDGRSDLLWRNGVNGQNVIWLMNGTAISSAALTTTVADLNYKVVGAGDTTSDGKAEIFWWNQSTGAVVLWVMNGTTLTSSHLITTVPTVWQVAAVGDFNGDGRTDLLWRNSSTTDLVQWWMYNTGITFSGFMTAHPDLSWSAVAPK